MKIAIITGSAGLIGSEAVRTFAAEMDLIVGIDNNMRARFFGDEASTLWNEKLLESSVPNYTHYSADIREFDAMERIFKTYGHDIALVIHAAAQPSHDWAAREPLTDFGVNAVGTSNLLECTRLHAHPQSVFIFTSTNKVYGDAPNELPLVETETRWEISAEHPYFENGIDENMRIDQSKHSLFGASKVAADVLAQEYGRYFGMNVGVFRGGCLTGPSHSGAQLHGFLSYLMKCAVSGREYTIFGYKGKQVRDNIHSHDLIQMFRSFYQNPRQGEVYNAGGGRFANCSMLEAIALCEEIAGKKMKLVYTDTNRIGDHIWYISDLSKFKAHYPQWHWQYDLRRTCEEIFEAMSER
ncbi:MAG: NAD-dependent epimerase/dehydratase family protein [Tannerellaceae bacterium]|jgi:CDP-paratose 2-epimerase|nr:NAD-dependent epimerase/dehydratase family protein [Tannerellaceae bacterium]